jgi:hypothetical protein
VGVVELSRVCNWRRSLCCGPTSPGDEVSGLRAAPVETGLWRIAPFQPD